MDSFRVYLYAWLAENDYIQEGELAVEELSMDYIMGETDASEDDVRDVWAQYENECQSVGQEPDNDLDGFTL